MQVALIIVSVFLAISVVFNLIFLHMLRNLILAVMQIDELQEELAFVQGETDIPDELIDQKFLDAILLCHIEKNPFDGDVWKIVDTSSYEKNHIIGLTYFVQPDTFEELKNAVSVDKIKDNVRQKIIDAIYDEDDEIDEDFINELIEQAYDEIVEEDYDIDEEHGTMTRPLLPHCTVYHLKDGRWLWRQESSS